MVRNYKRKAEMASYTDTQLQDAISAVERGQSKRGAAAEFGIPTKTLRRHCQGGVAQPGVSQFWRMWAVLTTHLRLSSLPQSNATKERCIACQPGMWGAYRSASRRTWGKRRNFLNEKSGMAGLDLATSVHEATPYSFHTYSDCH